MAGNLVAPNLVAQLRKRRERWVDLGDGRRVKFLRPVESEQGEMVKFEGTEATWTVGLDQVRKFVIGWEGFTEASIVGADVGGDLVVPFERELFDELVSDDLAWVGKVARAILDSIVDYNVKKADVAKNSSAASTSPAASDTTGTSPP